MQLIMLLSETNILLRNCCRCDPFLDSHFPPLLVHPISLQQSFRHVLQTSFLKNTLVFSSQSELIVTIFRHHLSPVKLPDHDNRFDSILSMMDFFYIHHFLYAVVANVVEFKN